MVLGPDPWGLPLAAERSVTGLGAKLEGALFGRPKTVLRPQGAGAGPAEPELRLRTLLKDLDRVGTALELPPSPPDALCFPLCALCVSGLCPGLHK